MFTGILIIAVIGLLGALSHRHSRLESKIYKNVPLEDWITVFILPVSLYIGWFFIVKTILLRPAVGLLPLDDMDILALSILFMIYGFVGNGIHFTGKILWRNLKGSRHTMAYKINEMFHGRLSHYLVYLNGLFIFFLLPILEINHPAPTRATDGYLWLSALTGAIFGYAVCRAIFYTNEWFGGYNKPLFIISSVLLFILVFTGKYYKINITNYPTYLFVISMYLCFIGVFILRQLMIFLKLGNRRRLRFLAKIFSIT